MIGAYLPSAAVSPRISGGTLKWYAGDTFTLYLHTELTDADGEAVEMGISDRLTVTFYDCCGRMVYSFGFSRLTDNTAALVFDETVSGKFPAGEYTYDVYLGTDRRVTVAKGCPVIVE